MGTRPILRGGLVGLGRMGLVHLAILNTHPDVVWAAVCDSTPLVLRQLQARMGFAAYSNARRMFDGTDLDFVVIATPPDSHGAVVRAALGRGLHVFVEKPLTLSAAEFLELAAEAAEAGVVTQIGYVNRFNEAFVEARRLLAAGALGDLRYLRSEMWGRTVLRPTRQGWRGQRASGGGCLYDFASHAVDLVHFLVGIPDEVRGSQLQRIHSRAVEDAVYTSFRGPAGLSGHVAVSWSDPSVRKPTNRVDIVGTNGRLTVEQYGLHVFIQEGDRRLGLDRGWNTRYITELAQPVRFYLRGNEYTRQLDHFIECVEAGAGSPVVSFADGAAVDETLERIAIDSRSGG